MRPKLAAVTGPLEGQSFEIGKVPFSIGRLSSNRLQLLEATASRRHCAIERSGDRLTLVDLGSHLGTFVNGLPVKRRQLEHGDFVKIATSVFLFLTRAAEAGRRVTAPPRVADDDWTAASTVRISVTETLEHDMVGESEPMKKVLRFISRVAPTDATVLVRGESGTGKELVARALHANSSRREGPFVAINCATLSETLLESELFGHERGAFTGAVARQPGKLELADGGTVFLDEVGEVPPPLQAKLLRALEERAFERVGGRQRIEVDLRLIAATNRDLEAAIRDGGFREDLYYRLNVVDLTLPPVRERPGDVEILAEHFAAANGKRAGKARGISRAALRCLVTYDWPGNVRELKNAVERALVLGAGGTIRAEDLPEAILENRPAGGGATTYHEAVNEAKRRIIREALDASDSVAAAARRLGLHRNYLHRLIRNLGLKPETER